MLETDKVIIDVENCIKCRRCTLVCPRSLYIFKDEHLELVDNFDSECIDCGHCSAVCPQGIIKLKLYSDKPLIPIPGNDDKASYEQLYNLSISRRSIRNFKKEIVPKKILEKILKIVQYSPTGHNEENVYYTIVQDQETLNRFSEEITKNIRNFVKKYEDPEGYESLKKILSEDALKKASEFVESFKRKIAEIEAGKEVWRWDTQIVIIHSPKNAATLVENCTLAAAHFMLAAETLGIATCSLGYATALINQFRSVAKIVKIPRNHIVGYTLAFGYPKFEYKFIPNRKSIKINWL
ncbi:MAG: nitroreductase family protein [Promethearchaeota archaeon]